MSSFQARAANVSLNDEIFPVGPPPDDLFMGCSIERRSVIIFFDFLLLLVFELGQDQFVFRAYSCSQNLITAVVILTIRRGLRDRMFLSLSTRSWCSTDLL